MLFKQKKPPNRILQDLVDILLLALNILNDVQLTLSSISVWREVDSPREAASNRWEYEAYSYWQLEGRGGVKHTHTHRERRKKNTAHTI